MAEVPPERERLLDVAERPRAHDWSLRSALTRYAQIEPQRVSEVFESVRRAESAIRPHQRSLLAGDEPADDQVRGVLDCLDQLDRLGEVLADWAGDPIGPTGEPPNREVDRVADEVARRLDELGVAREERRPPPGARRRG